MKNNNNDGIGKKKIIITISIVITIIIISVLIVASKSKKTEIKSPQLNSVQESQITNVENYVGELSDGTKVNTNAKMNKVSTLDNLNIDNIRLTLKNGITTFKANVTNTGDSKMELKEVTLILLDENGEELVSARGIINEIEPGTNQELAIAITSDYIHACGYKLIEK